MSHDRQMSIFSGLFTFYFAAGIRNRESTEFLVFDAWPVPFPHERFSNTEQTLMGFSRHDGDYPL